MVKATDVSVLFVLGIPIVALEVKERKKMYIFLLCLFVVRMFFTGIGHHIGR